RRSTSYKRGLTSACSRRRRVNIQRRNRIAPRAFAAEARSVRWTGGAELHAPLVRPPPSMMDGRRLSIRRRPSPSTGQHTAYGRSVTTLDVAPHPSPALPVPAPRAIERLGSVLSSVTVRAGTGASQRGGAAARAAAHFPGREAE